MKFTVLVQESGFEGEATINFPTREEKMELLKKLQGLGWQDNRAIADNEKLEMASTMGEIVESRLESINVTHVETGVVINSKELLSVYAEGNALSGLLSGWIIGGVPMGKLKS